MYSLYGGIEVDSSQGRVPRQDIDSAGSFRKADGKEMSMNVEGRGARPCRNASEARHVW